MWIPWDPHRWTWAYFLSFSLSFHQSSGTVMSTDDSTFSPGPPVTGGPGDLIVAAGGPAGSGATAGGGTAGGSPCTGGPGWGPIWGGGPGGGAAPGGG